MAQCKMSKMFGYLLLHQHHPKFSFPISILAAINYFPMMSSNVPFRHKILVTVAHIWRSLNTACSINLSLSGRHSDFAILPSRRINQIPLIPESPPPAYTQQPNALDAILTTNLKPFNATCSSANAFFPCKLLLARPQLN